MATFPSVEAYLDSLPAETRRVLEELRGTILGLLPDCVEVISYNIPAVQVDSRTVVFYAGWKKHVSVYPAPEDDPVLARDLVPYAGGKGTLRFPLDQPLPHELIARVVRHLAGP